MTRTTTLLMLGLVLAPANAHTAHAQRLRGNVAIDGSSTVYPITEAVAEEYRAVQPRVRVTVSISGTGGGFKKFVLKETDISDASRPIKQQEADKCAAAGIGYIELPVAYDGLAVLVNPKNTWVDHLTVRELNAIWKPDSTITRWSHVRPGFPDRPITLYAPGTDSGTFDYFTETINGKSGACRSDATFSEDDNVLVQGIAGDPDAIGFFGLAYYEENRDRLKLVPIDAGDGPVAPSLATVNDGTYHPLSRPIFIYVNAAAASRPEVVSFVSFYLENAGPLSREVGYVPLPDAVYRLARQRFEHRVTGSVFAGRKSAGKKLTELLAMQP